MLRNCSSALLLSTAAAETGLRVVSGRALSCVVGGVTTALVTVLRPRAKVARAFAAHFPPGQGEIWAGSAGDRVAHRAGKHDEPGAGAVYRHPRLDARPKGAA